MEAPLDGSFTEAAYREYTRMCMTEIMPRLDEMLRKVNPLVTHINECTKLN
jgi:hypothetical protein